MTHLPPMTSTGAGNGTLQGVHGLGMNTPATYSTYIPTSPREGSTAGTCIVNTEPLHNTSFPCFDGTDPHLWRSQCLEYFNRFNIHKCMWVVAATMHMEGKAKVWYEAYRLRQVVGDWTEFMDNVESHFSVKPTEPTLTQLLERIKLQCEQLKMKTDLQRAEPSADSSEEVLTHISGVSLFLELWVEPAEAVISETTLIEVVDDVFTCIGGSSLFLELGLDSEDEELASTMLNHHLRDITHRDNMVAFPLHNMMHMNYSGDSFYCPTMELKNAHLFASQRDSCTVGIYSLQLYSNSDTDVLPWDPGILLEKVFRLTMGNIYRTKIWYICSKFHISEETTGEVYSALTGCKACVPLLIPVLLHVELWRHVFLQIYPAQIWRCRQHGMIFADQENMSDAHEIAKSSKQHMVTGHQCMVTPLLFTYCCISMWLQSIQISVHRYMHFSTIGWWFRFSTCLKVLYCTWPNGEYGHMVYAPVLQPSHLLDQGAGNPFYQGCVIAEAPNLRSEIIPERSARQGYHFFLAYIPPWQRNSFSPRPNTLVKYQEQHFAWGDFQVKNQLTVQILQWYSLLVQLNISQFASNEWFPGIMSLNVAVQEKAMHFQCRHMHEINSIDSAAGDELQINGKFQLLEDRRIQIEVVSSCKAYNLVIIVQVPARYVRGSYVNRQPAYLDNISIPAVDWNSPDNKDRQMPWDPGGVVTAA